MTADQFRALLDTVGLDVRRAPNGSASVSNGLPLADDETPISPAKVLLIRARLKDGKQ